MMLPQVLPVSFYNRDVVEVARDLLGTCLVRSLDGRRISGTIIETEAYRGEEDLACHARAGRTPRTAVMYGAPGRAYIYFTYGMHWLLNCVCSAEGFPAAVLIRAIAPTEGLDLIAFHRPGRPEGQWCSGPAKLTQALAIDGRLNGSDLTQPGGELWIESGKRVSDQVVSALPRVGIHSVPEPWLSMPWRFVANRL